MNSVTETAIETQLQQLESLVMDRNAGLFGPQSHTWPICREAVVFVGAWRAAMLQLAHPWVARGIEEHSTTLTDPVGRFHRTFTAIWTMVYGDWPRVQSASRALFARHGSITGHLQEETPHFSTGTAYQANAEEALIWVHATLWETTITIHELIFGPLAPEKKEAFYQETKRFAMLFGIDPDQLPADWPDFLAYNQSMWEGDILQVGDAARAISQGLFSVKQLPLSRLWLPVARTCTAEIFPEPLRSAFGLPTATPATKRTLDRTVWWIRATLPLLPKKIRHVPPWHETQHRLKGHHRADPVTRQLCQWWIGRKQLVIGK